MLLDCDMTLPKWVSETYWHEQKFWFVCAQIDTSVLFWTERVLHMFKGKVQKHIKTTYTLLQTDRIEFSAHLK